MPPPILGIMTAILDQQELLALLDWQRAMGAGAALGDTPLDWLARGPLAPGAGFAWPARGTPARGTEGEQPRTPERPLPGVPSVQSPSASQRTPPPTALRVEAPVRPQTPLAPSAAETDARRIARAASSLESLGAALKAFDGCTLKATATNLCFYRGAAKSRLMLIGEAPGRDEDIAGKPFVGRAGQLLDKMLAAINLTEADVHITNIVYWRPPGNRTPTPQEALACRPFLERQIELVAPEIVLAVGGAAAKEVFGTADGIMRLRGKWREIEIGGTKIAAMATLHPAYLLRTPAAKQMVWQDLLALKAKLGV